MVIVNRCYEHSVKKIENTFIGLVLLLENLKIFTFKAFGVDFLHIMTILSL